MCSGAGVEGNALAVEDAHQADLGEELPGSRIRDRGQVAKYNYFFFLCISEVKNDSCMFLTMKNLHSCIAVFFYDIGKIQTDSIATWGWP
jgi:hypothetical protein